MEQQINIKQTDTFSIKDNAIHEELDGSIFIFNVHNGEYYELDSTSLFIWKLLKKNGNDFNDISKKMMIETSKIKKFFKKYLMKKDETSITSILSKYMIGNQNVIQWVKDNFECYDVSENV